jgi:DNA-binding MarR family transcriptional regulator
MFEPEKETTQFAFILYRCAIAFRNELNREFTSTFNDELNADFWFILSALWEEDNISNRLLAERVSRDKASLSRTLDLMAEKGLIKRLADSGDKRELKIALTKRAKELKEKATQTAIEFTKNELRGLSPIEVKELMRMLNHIFKNIKG